MESKLKKFLAAVRPRETRELVQDHVKRVEVSATTVEVTLYVDKRYAFHAIVGHEHAPHVVRSVKKAFGKQATTIVQLDKGVTDHEREKALPHAIHFR